MDHDFDDSLLLQDNIDEEAMMSSSMARELVRSMSKESSGAFGSKITQWVQAVRKTSEDLTSNDDESEEASNNGSGHGGASSSLSDHPSLPVSPNDKFDWKKLGLGRGQFMPKLKSPNLSGGSSPLLPNHMKRNGSGRNIFRKADPSPAVSRVGAPPFATTSTSSAD